MAFKITTLGRNVEKKIFIYIKIKIKITGKGDKYAQNHADWPTLI